MTWTHENKGFTLIEILILVIILGILAAIVLPQFSSASPAMGDSSFSDVADSQRDGNTSTTTNNPSYPIESASARTDESR
jgi:prepilin-type N-terminal cleavage/methylation domain-containing protein